MTRRRLSSSLPASVYLDAAVLGLLVGAVTALNLLWVSLDNRPPHWDMARHLGDSLFYRSIFDFSHPLRVLEAYVYYPPFTYWVTDLFYGVFGTGLRVAILSNVVFLSVLVYATYGIGRRLWSRAIGLLATVFVLSTPMLVTHFKMYMLDAPLTALVTLALYLLIRSEDFSRRTTSLAFGAVCGCGFLTKWTFGFFLALPSSVVAAAAIRRRSVTTVVNIVGAGVIAFAVCGVWYVHNFHQIAKDVSFNGSAAGLYYDAPPVGSLASVLWYFWALVNAQLYLIPFLFFAVGVIAVVWKDESAAGNFHLVLAIVGACVAFTLLRNKDLRFTVPMLPAAAIIATHWLEYLPRGRKLLVASAVVTYSVAAFLVISFGTSLIPKQIRIPIGAHSYASDLGTYLPDGRFVKIRGVTVFAQHGNIIGPPSHEKWYQAQIFQEISRAGVNPTFWFAGPDSIWFNTWGTRYYSLEYHETWVASPKDANFLVVRGSIDPGVRRGFVAVARYRLPDGEPLILYERA